MKKLLIFIIFILVFPIVAHASSATCTYYYKRDTKTIEISVNYKYGFLLEYNSKDSRYKIESFDVNNIDFVNANGDIECPGLKFEYRMVDRGDYRLNIKKASITDTGVYYGTISNLINDGKEKDNANSNNVACKYMTGTKSEYSLVWYDELEVTLTGSRYKNSCDPLIQTSFSAEDFKDGNCPAVYETFVARHEGIGCKGRLIISKNPILSDNQTSNGADSKEDVSTGDNIIIENPGVKPNVGNLDNCTSLLGNPSDEYSPAWFLSFAFGVMRYVAIIILIVMSILDFVNAVTSHDNDELKKAMEKFGTRLISCVIIFILPTLIEFVLQIVHETKISDCIKLQ